MSTTNLQKAEAAINQFTNQPNVNNELITNQASRNLTGNLVSSNLPNLVQGQQNLYATPGTSNQFIQSNSNIQSNIQAQQYLNPNRPPQTTSPLLPLSYPSQPANPTQFGTLQNNIQRVIGAPTGTQTSIQSRNIENQLGRIPPNINTSHLIDNQPPKNFSGTSKIQYMPFQRKIIEHEQKQVKQIVPRVRKVMQTKQQVRVQLVPRQVQKIDYYAIQHIKQYVPEYVPEVSVNYVQKAVPFKRIQYVPVTRQVYHGAPLGGEGVQNLGMCGGVQMPMAGTAPWQNNINVNQLYGMGGYGGVAGIGAASLGGLNMGTANMGGYKGIYGAYGGVLPYNCCDQFKKRVNNIYDSYQSYVPSFQY